MNLFLATFEAVAVLLGIGIVGFLILKKDVLPTNVLRSLSPLALEIALPSIIFINIINDFNPTNSPNWWQLPLWWMFFTIVAFLLSKTFAVLSTKETKQEFTLSLFYQNGIFFPLAILTSMFAVPDEYVVSLFLLTIFFPAFFFSSYPFFFKNTKKSSPQLPLKKIFHPAFLATLIGIVLVFAGVQTQIPSLLLEIVTLLGAMTVPLLMLILGGNIYIDSKQSESIYTKEIIKFTLIKNFAFPILFLGILLILRPYLTPLIALLLLLQAAVPPITALPIITQRLDGNNVIVSQFLVASFLTSLLSLPLMVYLFQLFY